MRELHRTRISEPRRIRTLLAEVERQGLRLSAGLNPLTEARWLTIEGLHDDRIVLRGESFLRLDAPQLFLAFELWSTSYFFVGQPLGGGSKGRVAIRWPRFLYEAERRELLRSPPGSGEATVTRAKLGRHGDPWIPARVTDRSYDGLGLEVRDADAARLPRRPLIRLLDGEEAGRESHGVVRYQAPSSRQRGWTRIGLSVSEVESREPLEVERYELPLAGAAKRRPRGIPTALRDLAHMRRRHRRGSRREPRVRPIEYCNAKGERIRALVDSLGDTRGAPLVVIPPAWGRTKETLLPLARTIVETFRRAGQPVVVIRFDGIRRRGESHNDPECLETGLECMHFTLSQAVDDIHTTLDYVGSAPEFQPEKIGLLTTSIAAIDGRRAIARDARQRVDGWVSLVGITDLQSSLRVFSGGVDYGAGLLRGLRFGRQELLGVLCDMDLLGGDALEQKLWFLEDARRDMAAIDVPITWIHGRHDAWMQLERVREILSCGDASRRRLIEIPAGHQLRTSETADSAFRLAAQEIARTLLGREIEGRTPESENLARRQALERRRLPAPGYDLRRFWKDYLVGRRSEVGIELLTNTSAYRGLMSKQVRALALRPGDRVVDLGAGAGSFPAYLCRDGSRDGGWRDDVSVVMVDFVAEGLARARTRLEQQSASRAPGVEALVANLDLKEGGFGIPVRSESCDAILASLLIGYLKEPSALIGEMHRVLKPGGRLVVSNVMSDADLSKIYVESLGELPRERIAELFGPGLAADAERLRQDFLNDASRIMDLEEFGAFRFWNAEELSELVRKAGFRDLQLEEALGDPPQALVLRALRS